MGVTGTVDIEKGRQGAVFVWRVKDFSKILFGDECSFSSPYFHFFGQTWNMKLNTHDQSGNIKLILWSQDQSAAPNILFSLGVRSARGTTEMEVAGVRNLCGRKSWICVLQGIIDRSELFSRRDELWPLDVLTVIATLKGRSPAAGTRNLPVQTRIEDIAADDETHEQGLILDSDTKDGSVHIKVEDIEAEDGKDEQDEKTGRSHCKQREVSFPTLSGASAATRPTPTDEGRIMAFTGTVEKEIGQQGPVFVWRIKDFSKILDTVGRGYASRIFHFCGHAWLLRLETTVSRITLLLWSDDPGPAVDIQFSVGIRSASGKTEMEFAGSHSFYGGKHVLVVSAKVIDKSEFFRRREELLQLDVLTITASLKGKSPAEGRSHSKQREVSFPTLSGASVTTRPAPTDGGHIMADTGIVERVEGLQGTVFVWKVKDFSKILDEVQAEFNLCGRTFLLRLKTEGDYIYLDLMSHDSAGPAVDIQFSLGFRSTSGKTEMEFGGSCSFNGGKDMILLSGKRFQKSELFRRREELLPLDVLTIAASLKIKSPAEGTRDVSVQTGADCIAAENGQYEKEGKTDTKDVSVQTRVEDIAPEDGKDVRSEKTGTERVLQDIGKLWPNDENCDVVFRVGDVEFKAHRLILSARTPVLGAMFSHDTVEKASGVVTIEDCEPPVFEQLLHYVYKGAPRELTPENAYQLFTVADKYLVSEVKTLCVRFLRDTLCVDTFCSTVTLALMHKEDELLEIAVDFFSRNMLDIVQTVQWQTFNRDHSTWANEILIRSLKIRQEKKT